MKKKFNPDNFLPSKKKNDTNHIFLLNSLNAHKEHRVSIPRTFHLPQPPPSSSSAPATSRPLYIRGKRIRRLTISHFQASPHDPGK